MSVKQLFFASLLFILISCHHSYEPKRVNGVPLTAFWVGGADGGNWFLIEKIDTVNEVIHLKIYNDFTGELLTDKPFILLCKSNSSIDWRDIKNLISSFDGKIVYLQTASKANTYCYFQ